MHRITVITQHMSTSDLNYQVLKELVRMHSLGHEVCWMYENDCPPFSEIKIPKMSIGKLWEDQSNNGTLIATSIESAALIKNIPNGKRKLLYMWNLEFMWAKGDYIENLDSLKGVEIITRSESYSNIINNYLNVKPRVLDFDLEKICQ